MQNESTFETFESAQVNELYAALAKAQGEFAEADKDANNPYFKSKYATLAENVRASRPALSKHGLSVTQKPLVINGTDYLVTKLCHSSGQWTEARASIKPAKQDIQGWGSYVTYLRRYCYASICGVITGDDDDGESDRIAHEKISKSSVKEEKISEDQFYELSDMIGEDDEYRTKLLKLFNIDSLMGLPKKNFSAVVRSATAHNLKKQQQSVDAAAPA
jgi:hypothetical protein